ncbi:HNH endonuclease [Sinomonas sp. RB5]
MADEPEFFIVPEDEAAQMRATERRPSLPWPDIELPALLPGKNYFLVPEELLHRPRLPRKKREYRPYQDPPEMLVPVSEMTEETWAEWEWPADHDRAPTIPRQAVLILWRRDGNICQVCGLTVDIRLRWPHPGSAQIDHLDPMGWRSGRKRELDTWGNVQLAHAHCNSAHHNFDQHLIAVADYRHELRRAIEAAAEGRGAPMPPWTRRLARGAAAGPGMDGPWESEAWRREQELGRPKASFGQEWPVL